jgi:hypothetical protein
MTEQKRDQFKAPEQKKDMNRSISLRDFFIANAPVTPDWYDRDDSEGREFTWPVWWADRMLLERKSKYKFSVVEQGEEIRNAAS